MPNRLMVIANRLPVKLVKQPDGSYQWQNSDGGLVRALDPILSRQAGCWIGWDGIQADNAGNTRQSLAGNKPYDLHPVQLTAQEYQDFYMGFSNEIIWPLFHNFPSRCCFEQKFWDAYLNINQRYAQKTLEAHQPGDRIWVHDYHLAHTGHYLRTAGVHEPIGFFLHIPFPPVEIFSILPWREQWLQAVAEYDVVGFQTQRDADNFMAAARHLLNARIVNDTSGDQLYRIDIPGSSGHTLLAGPFPISVCSEQFIECSQTQSVKDRAQQIRQDLSGRQIFMSLERLDYTKGVLDKLEAFEITLQQYPELRRQLTLVQFIIPSRESIKQYQQLKYEIEHRIGEINGEYSESGWVPIHYFHHGMPFEEMLAYYQAADAMLVTPLKDGLNLVAKEYCLSNSGDGVLILSEFAGAAYELSSGALLINPYDHACTAQTIYQAYHMTRQDREHRMAKLKQWVIDHDVLAWRDRFLSALNRIPIDSPGA